MRGRLLGVWRCGGGLIGRGIRRFAGDHVGGRFWRLRHEARAEVILRRRFRKRLPQRLVADLRLVEHGCDPFTDGPLRIGKLLLRRGERRSHLLAVVGSRLWCGTGRHLLQLPGGRGDRLSSRRLLRDRRGDFIRQQLVAGNRRLPGSERFGLIPR